MRRLCFLCVHFKECFDYDEPPVTIADNCSRYATDKSELYQTAKDELTKPQKQKLNLGG